ncbi:MAG TPA: phosphate ABC transporter substrate-binding/OmpA family protein [Candidatus Dormibacteraeota bacterium]|nr:phosphate ABC transporter substrate-binding/OmpA family protein [Candidatus Dormibacteraeota bacterium]
MTARGKLILTLIILGVVAFGVWQWRDKFARGPGAGTGASNPSAPAEAAPAELVETLSEVPALAAPAAYQPKDDTVDIELSEYAGYAGLLVANGGLAPNTNSFFFQRHGFKLNIKLSEEESWPALNSGKMAASATTVDVLAVYGKQFQVLVPAQIGYSRGADGVVVRKEIKRINGLKGQILATSQFTEAEFFIRYLAQEAGLSIHALRDLNEAPAPDSLNLVFCKDAFAAGDFFLRELKQGRQRLAGCVTWAPKTTEVVEQSAGKAHVLTTSLNLLVVADILIVNKGFAQQHTNMVAGLVAGLLEGNRMIRDNQAGHLDVVAKAFKWERDQAKAELAKVHLANLPENLAFFSGSIDAAGSFGGIYQSAVYAYGPQVIRDPVDADRFLELRHLKAVEASGAFAEQKVAIKPIRSTTAAAVEGDPVLSKDIRFLFEPNSATLDLKNQDNLNNLEVIKKLLQVSPGSVVLLRGHVDNARVEEFRKTGGETYVRTMALRAIELSKNRSTEIKRVLLERFQLDPARIDIVGRGWEEPVGTDSDKNRRVEVQWFMLE